MKYAALVLVNSLFILAACGGGGGGGDEPDINSDSGNVSGSDIEPDPQVNEMQGSVSDGGSEAADNLLDEQSRDVAIETLETLDVVEYLVNQVSPLATAENISSNVCDAGTGSITSVAGGSGTQLAAAQCVVSSVLPVQLSGQITATPSTTAGDESSDVDFSDVILQLETYQVRATGSMTINRSSGSLNVSAQQLTLTDNQGSALLTDLSYTQFTEGSGNVNTSISYSAELSRYATTIQIQTTETMISDGSVECPVDGDMTASDSAGNQLVVSGQPGGNLLYTNSISSETLSCSEFSSFNAGRDAGRVFTPPSPPTPL